MKFIVLLFFCVYKIEKGKKFKLRMVNRKRIFILEKLGLFEREVFFV